MLVALLRAHVHERAVVPPGSVVLEERGRPLRHGRQRVRRAVDDSAAEGLAHRLEGYPGVEVEAVSDQHGEPALLSTVADVGDHRGLADGGVAADAHGRAQPGRGWAHAW